MILVLANFCLKSLVRLFTRFFRMVHTRDLFATRTQVFQRRQDGATGFYRNWESYEEGFGEEFGEYWIGELTSFVYIVQITCSLFMLGVSLLASV